MINKNKDSSEGNKPILTAKILEAHGVKGHVLLISFTEPALNILKLPLFTANSSPIKLKLINYIAHKNRLVCSVSDIKDRNEAEKLIGSEIFCYRQNFPKIVDEDEFYAADLCNMPVVDELHNEVGIVKNVLNFGAGDILEIEFADQRIELFPFTKAIFPEITTNYIMFKITTYC